MAAEQPWVLADTTWRFVRDAHYDVAVLPWGATEAHNLHLPYGTDTIESDHVAHEAARIAWQAGARVVALPTVPFGVNTGQLDIPLCLNLNPSTQAAVLRDIMVSVERAAVGKLVIVNGHGGNDFRQIIRELQPDTDVFLCTLNWYACVDAATYFDEPGDHAGELETSVMQHLAPQLVAPLSSAGDGHARHFRLGALREGWAWAPRQWTQVTADTGVGNPRAATPERGSRFFTAATQRIAEFLIELAAADLNAMYQE
ncbi:MAG: creatininase family protein [Gemmatimonadales bacterium]